ncbi:MAG TPA: hypothetical protein PK156_13915, partial [Polyangium sp.]|nr:hypothetical protein [Polyangium sp.]
MSSGKCEAGSCVLTGCAQGWNDCDLVATNGCESDPLADPSNCSTCGMPCAGFPNAQPACAAGMCALGACVGTFADCDLLPANGCETDVMTTAAHCSTCNNACVLANSNEVCLAGSCAVGSCESGFSDCYNVDNDGCEINTQTDPQNCGTCDSACSLPNSSTKCVMGSCKVDACAPPFADCNLVATDGCETNINTNVNNCGACGTVCMLANATPACSNGGCTIAMCNAGFGDCDGMAANGCETNLNTSATNCGSCGAGCSTNNGTPSCMSGMCSIACNVGFANCDMNVANGCEINTTNNVNNCGMCMNSCPPAGGTPACNNSTCGVSMCAGGRGDCDGNSMNGCETTITNDVNNCGGCGIACFVANGTPSCTSGNCTILSCNTGFADCDGLYANGCETNLRTNSNCGGCGVTCAYANANTSCSTGTCEITSCVGTFANCDGNKTNGCEINTATNTSNCGACMNQCSSTNGSATCTNGS